MAAEVDEVAPGILRVRSALGSRWLQQWIVKGRDGALLLDTGIAGETVPSHIEPALRAAAIDPAALTEVVISHADVDHYGGNAELRRLAPAATFRAHPLDRALIESVERIERDRYGWYRRYGLDYPPDVWRFIRAAAGADTALDATVEEGGAIELGGARVEVLHLPGHSAGHVALFHPASRTAIIGDAVMGRGFEGTDGRAQVHPPAYEDADGYAASITRLRELGPARLCTGHFPVIEGDDVAAFLELSASFVDELDSAVRTELGDRPRGLGQLLTGCAARVGGYAEMELELARSIGAHLERLEAMGGAERIESQGEAPRWRRSA
jgi:glyoxylase-like metal-dependent hydrolase (beta-lactamase superfamily II)